MRLVTVCCPFRPAIHHLYVLREAGLAPQEGLPENGWPTKRAEDFSDIECACCQNGL